MMRAFMVGVIVGVLITASHAQAAEPTAPPEGWHRAYESAAMEYWHGQKPRDCTSHRVHWNSAIPGRFTAYLAETAVLGYATLTYPGEPTACNMWVAPLGRFDVYFRCVLYAHEYGHWLGHGDEPSTPETSVRYELLGNYTHDAPCRRLASRTHAPEWAGEAGEGAEEGSEHVRIIPPFVDHAPQPPRVKVTEYGIELE